MAASAGNITLIGRSGRSYSMDMYIPDAVATQIGFNTVGLATSGSPTTFRCPEDMTLVDISDVAGMTAVGVNLKANDQLIIGGSIRWASRVSTLSRRAPLSIGFRAGDIISGLQF